MKKLFKNTGKASLLCKGGVSVKSGGVAEIEESDLNPALIESGVLVETIEVPVDPEPEQKGDDDKKEGEGEVNKPTGDDPWTLKEAAQALFTDPTLLSEDDYTKGGKPEIKALEGVFENTEFDAASRDELWDHVQELKDASNAS